MEVEKVRYINEVEVSHMIGRALQTLRNDRHCGRGLPYTKIGRSVRYNLQEIIDFMESHRIETDAL